MSWHNRALALAILVSPVVGNAWGAAVYPMLSLSPDYFDLRTVQGGAATPGSSAINISMPKSNTSGDFVLSSPTLTVAPASGIVARAKTYPIPFSLGWADTSTLGPQTPGVITLTGHDVDPNYSQMTVNGFVVANRQLTVAPIGTSLIPLRTMVRTPVATTIFSGSNPVVDGDNYATRVNTVPRGKALSNDTHGVIAAFSSTPLAQFNGVDQSAALSVTFTKTGSHTSSFDLAPRLLKDGEAKSAGAAVRSATLSYNVEVLEQRRLKLSNGNMNFGNVLKGATVSQTFVANSLNVVPDAQHTTKVNVSRPGGTPIVTSVGTLTVTSTLIDRNAVPVTVTGTMNTYGTLKSLRSALAVTTAEVGIDTRAYRDLKVSYSANVGLAKLGKTKGSFSDAMVLSAFVPKSTPGSTRTLAGLASKVTPRGTLVEDPLLAANVTPVELRSSSFLSKRSNLRGLFGVVGSEAEIVASSEIADDTTVTMQWRQRSDAEAQVPGAGPAPTPPDAKWLTSDVVKIGGISTDVVYALQMTFDHRINMAIEQEPASRNLDAQKNSMYIAEMNDAGTLWERKVVGTGHWESLSEFLAANNDKTIEELEGEWGIDVDNVDQYGRGTSWAIVRGGGSGVFAVVPEPATMVLLISAAIGMFGYGMRYYRRTNPKTAARRRRIASQWA